MAFWTYFVTLFAVILAGMFGYYIGGRSYAGVLVAQVIVGGTMVALMPNI